MKISIIGVGRVGATAGFYLQTKDFIKEINLVDVNKDLAEGEALDLRHGVSLSCPVKIYASDYASCKDSDIIVITAGSRRKPDESRLDLIKKNISLFKKIIDSLKSCNKKSILVVVSNPVDILTHVACKISGFDKHRIIGLGTLLDTTRFRSLLAEHFAVRASDVDALILGEHGESMFPVWSQTKICGRSIYEHPLFDREEMEKVFVNTKKGGAEVIRLKHGAGYSVALAIGKLIENIALQKKEPIPVSSYIQESSYYSVSDCTLSLPAVVGNKGIHDIADIALTEAEKAQLMHSASVLKETLKQIEV